MIVNTPSLQTNSIDTDYEWSGEINRATVQGAKFALLLAMLEDNPLLRPVVEADDAQLPAESALPKNYYRPMPLFAEEADWSNGDVMGELLHKQLQDALLFRAMHPQPLSLYNDPKRIDDEVLANCSFSAQRRLADEQDKVIHTDATQMYDVVQQAQAF